MPSRLYFALPFSFLRRLYVRMTTSFRVRRRRLVAPLLSERKHLEFRMKLGFDLLSFDDGACSKAIRLCRLLGIRYLFCDPQCVQEELDRLCLPKATFVVTERDKRFVGGKASVLMYV